MVERLRRRWLPTRETGKSFWRSRSKFLDSSLKISTNIQWLNTFQVFKPQGRLTLLEVYTDWAGPCTAMATILAKVKVSKRESNQVKKNYWQLHQHHHHHHHHLHQRLPQLELQMGKLGSSAGCQLHHILTFASACADTVQVNVFTEKFKESQALQDFRHNCTPTWLFIASGCFAAALEIIIGILAIYAMCPVERRESRWIIVHMVRGVILGF